MDWRVYQTHGRDRGPEFYRTTLEYGHYLWQQGLVARAILCLDRAMGTDLHGRESILAEWPIPYAAMRWILAHCPNGVFMGNPRVHFQHYADRMNEPRREQRRWRAWACWAITRRTLPHLLGDPRHQVREPAEDEIEQKLQEVGLPGEAGLWRHVMEER
jgi:hypothetical protein